jgi:hypothetical protein
MTKQTQVLSGANDFQFARDFAQVVDVLRKSTADLKVSSQFTQP